MVGLFVVHGWRLVLGRIEEAMPMYWCLEEEYKGTVVYRVKNAQQT